MAYVGYGCVALCMCIRLIISILCSVYSHMVCGIMPLIKRIRSDWSAL